MFMLEYMFVHSALRDNEVERVKSVVRSYSDNDQLCALCIQIQKQFF